MSSKSAITKRWPDRFLAPDLDSFPRACMVRNKDPRRSRNCWSLARIFLDESSATSSTSSTIRASPVTFRYQHDQSAGRNVGGLPLHPAAEIYYHRNDLLTSDRLGRCRSSRLVSRHSPQRFSSSCAFAAANGFAAADGCSYRARNASGSAPANRGVFHSCRGTEPDPRRRRTPGKRRTGRRYRPARQLRDPGPAVGASDLLGVLARTDAPPRST